MAVRNKGGRTYSRAVSVDASPHQDGVPRIPCLIRLVEFICPTNVTFRRVANEVDSLGRRINTMSILPPLLQKSCRELEGS
jgi:hypothetical protein